MGSPTKQHKKSIPTPEKPRAERIQSEITQLPTLTPQRCFFRRVIRAILNFLIWLLIDSELKGLEKVPKSGAAIVVSNHLGDMDAILGWAFSPRIDAEAIIKSEIHDIKLLGFLLDVYGVIWVHRGQPDRKMIRIAKQALSEGRIIGIAPEGRESLTGGLEEGTQGAAYLALKTNVPIIPITFTGTENTIVYNNLKKLRRTKVTMTVGDPFRIARKSNRKEALKLGTRQIMKTLASQLPEEYRGFYAQL